MNKLPLLNNLETVNEVLEKLQISKISAKAVEDGKVIERKIVEVGDAIRDKLRAPLPLSVGDIVMTQMKENFDAMEKDDQYRVLTSMPPDSTVEFLKNTFKITDHHAKRAKVIRDEQGFFSTPNPKPGRRIPEDIFVKVKQFYESDEISRQMPGKKDSVSMLVSGVKKQVQKRLILLTVYEAFLLFKEKFPEIKLGFSKFAEARPKNIVLPGSAGTHNVCVCTYHQNPKLMISNSQIGSKKEFKTLLGDVDGDSYSGEIKYQHLVSKILCNPPREECWLNSCKQCEDTSVLEKKLISIFAKLDVDEVTYKQWQSTDRTELVTITESTADFVQSLIAKIQVLKVHMFIHDMQTKHFYDVKENLSPGEVLVVGDFSENYSFVVQDAAQGVHWSNSSCTLHPWVCYYKEEEDSVIKTLSVLFISDCLTHDTIAVYAFQKHLIALLKKKVDLTAIQYFSDGCSKQYKNKKNFLNLAYHASDFGVLADWSFSATSHGKGPWDGLAGSAKREAALESLRRPQDNQILTPLEFYKFTKEKFKNVVVDFVSQEDITNLHSEVLEDRFECAKTIKGTLGFHSYSSIPGCYDSVIVKQFDKSTKYKKVSVTKAK